MTHIVFFHGDESHGRKIHKKKNHIKKHIQVYSHPLQIHKQKEMWHFQEKPIWKTEMDEISGSLLKSSTIYCRLQNPNAPCMEYLPTLVLNLR